MTLGPTLLATQCVQTQRILSHKHALVIVIDLLQVWHSALRQSLGKLLTQAIHVRKYVTGEIDDLRRNNGNGGQ